MSKRFFVFIQYLLPHHAFSILAGKLANSRWPWLKSYLIKRFIATYAVDMREAEAEDPATYPSFNAFFTRALKKSTRPICEGSEQIAAPADGVLAQLGTINKNQLLQAKDFYFDLTTLLGGHADLATPFINGTFATIYLAPHNYHRVHMPLAGTLKHALFVPGKLFSVNLITSQVIPGLFSRNERLITLFETEAGKMAVILVGAMMVGSIKTVWMDVPVREQSENLLPSTPLFLKKGEELGYFCLGSTVILLFESSKVDFSPNLKTGASIQYGQNLGNILTTC